MLKKTISAILIALMIVSGLSMFPIKTYAAEADVSVTQISGMLNAPGTSAMYLITDKNGEKIENFTSKYSIRHDVKFPLSVSEPQSVNVGEIIEIKIMDTCSTSEIQLTGTVSVFDLSDTSKRTIILDASTVGPIKNEVVRISGDISITSDSGSRVYDFSTSGSNLNIYFGEDAAINTTGVETGQKCLAYNIDPNQNVKSKYSLNNSNSAFVNFVGEPKFDNPLTITLSVPVDSDNIKLYQLKEGSTSELEEVKDIVSVTDDSSEYIAFTTDRLASTYVITGETLAGVTSSEPTQQEPPTVVEPPSTEGENPGFPVIEPDKDPSPQTGDEMTTYMAIVFSMTAVVAVSIYLYTSKSRQGK